MLIAPHSPGPNWLLCFDASVEEDFSGYETTWLWFYGFDAAQSFKVNGVCKYNVAYVLDMALESNIHTV